MNGAAPQKDDPKIDCKKILDDIQKVVYPILKPYGFKKHGRSLHRFVSGDISQVINFQLGQSYLGYTHLLSVNVGIRVPECMTRSFEPEMELKKYYPEYACNMRSRLGAVEGKSESVYNLYTDLSQIEADIIRQIRDYVLPAFEELNSREAILEKRRAYPNMDTLNSHLIRLEEAMIYGRWGLAEKASELFNEYYADALSSQKSYIVNGHCRYLRELAQKLNIDILD